jgi:hypothetical protein
LKDLPVWLPLNQFSHPAEVQAVNINKSEKNIRDYLCVRYTLTRPQTKSLMFFISEPIFSSFSRASVTWIAKYLKTIWITWFEVHRSVQYNKIKGKLIAINKLFKGKVHHLLFVRIGPFADPIYHPTFQCAVSSVF